MSFTLVNSGAASNSGSGGTLGVAVDSVNVGDLVFVAGSHGTDTGAMTCSDGTSSLTGLTQLNFGNSAGAIQGFYLLSSVASGTVTYTITYTGTPGGRNIVVYVFTPSATPTFDKQNGSEVVSTNGVSGNVTTTGTDELAFGAQLNENASASSAEAVNSVARTAVIDSGNHSTLWYTTPSATFTGQATETIGSSTRILTIIGTFYIPLPIITVQPQQQVVVSGSTANFTITATGTGTLHYQWKLNGSNVGTDSSSYTTAATTNADNLDIVQCIVTDNNGSTNSYAVYLLVIPTASIWLYKS